MVKRLQTQTQSSYGLPQPTVNQFPTPIISSRDPTTADTGYILGQIWVNKLAGTMWGMTSNSGGVANWVVMGTLTNVFTTITADTYLTGDLALQSTLIANAWDAIGTNAAIDLKLTPKGTGDVAIVTGYLDILEAGSGISIAEGANGRMGSSTLVAGTKSIAIASVTANTRVFLTRTTAGAGAVGFLVSDISVPGTLTVSSVDALGVSAATDTSSFDYLCIEAL